MKAAREVTEWSVMGIMCIVATGGKRNSYVIPHANALALRSYSCEGSAQACSLLFHRSAIVLRISSSMDGMQSCNIAPCRRTVLPTYGSEEEM